MVLTTYSTIENEFRRSVVFSCGTIHALVGWIQTVADFIASQSILPDGIFSSPLTRHAKPIPFSPP